MILCEGCHKPLSADWMSHCKPCYSIVMRKADVAGKISLAECKLMLEPDPQVAARKDVLESPWKCEHEFINGFCECGTFEEQFWFSINAPLERALPRVD